MGLEAAAAHRSYATPASQCFPWGCAADVCKRIAHRDLQDNDWPSRPPRDHGPCR